MNDDEYEEWLLEDAKTNPGQAGLEAAQHFAEILLLGKPISLQMRMHLGERFARISKGEDPAQALDLKKKPGRPEGETWRTPVAVVGALAQRSGCSEERVYEFMSEARMLVQKAERQSNPNLTERAPRPLPRRAAREVLKAEGAAIKDASTEHLQRLATKYGVGSIVDRFRVSEK